MRPGAYLKVAAGRAASPAVHAPDEKQLQHLRQSLTTQPSRVVMLHAVKAGRDVVGGQDDFGG